MTATIVGIGQTEYSKNSGRTELSLAAEAILGALGDAGLRPGDVDAVIRYDWDNIDELTLGTHLGFGNLRWMSQVGDGGPAGNAVIAQAKAVIEAGLAETVLCYRALNGRSGERIGQGDEGGPARGAEAFQIPWGMVAPVTQFGQFARRHMVRYGTTSEQFGAVAVAMRRHAMQNPAAVMRKPITLEDHQNSRMIADPLRLLDCCIETDGACAVVITTADRARDLARRPVEIVAGAQASGPGGGAAAVFRTDLDVSEAVHCANDLWSRAGGITPSDVDVAMVYDHFTPFVIIALESFGLCPTGEGGRFVEDGNIELGGSLPVNTHGGNHSEAYLQGLSHVIEAVRQLRGDSTAQVNGAETALSCSATAGTSSAVLLRRSR
ncbi:lipid-transfer protein [Rhodococcus sp. NPDC057529]|uniref:thiolase C-terminal domain-containing protein n=1 Tax=Rhodococcus sp. NPDC057529 TaxID=3346158 RepID=UPI00366BD56A